MSEMKPLRDLWIAVLFRAVADAARADENWADTAERLDRLRARDWILGGGPDFREVCDMAGFHPEDVIGVVRSGRAKRWLRIYRGPHLGAWSANNA